MELIQLFRERLSEKKRTPQSRKVLRVVLSSLLLDFGISGKSDKMARDAMDVCLRVLKESQKSRFDSYSVRNSVLIISEITLAVGICRVHFLSDNLSRNSWSSSFYYSHVPGCFLEYFSHLLGYNFKSLI